MLSTLQASLGLVASSPVLRPAASVNRWDAVNVANPVVLPPPSGVGEWRMFYYGNDGTWAGDPDVQPFLPTGKVGLATSTDGVSWERIDGPCADASTFGPSGQPDDWDGLHVGVGDVLVADDGSLVMYYFGASKAKIEGGPPVVGIGMKIGRATSTDGGLNWERGAAPVLDADADEGLFCSWPRVLPPRQTGEAGLHRMIYHAFNGQKWRVFSAASRDDGRSWEREGAVLLPGGDGAFDENGIGTRTIAPWRGGSELLMVYEGVDAGGTHRLGVATSSDGGRRWHKLEGEGLDGVGGPILAPGAAGAWTNQVVGTPYLVAVPDSSELRLYHCAKPNAERGGMCIGGLVSVTGAVTPDAWTPLVPDGAYAYEPAQAVF